MNRCSSRLCKHFFFLFDAEQNEIHINIYEL